MKSTLFIIVVFILINSIIDKQPSGASGQHSRQKLATIDDQHGDGDFQYPIYNYERSHDSQPHRNNRKAQQRRSRQQKPTQDDMKNVDLQNKDINDDVYYNNNNNVHLPPLHKSSSAKQPSETHLPSSSYLNHFPSFNPKFDPNHAELMPSCSEINGFSPGQIRLCQLYPDHVLSILQAAKLAAEECRFQFSVRRWNCSLIPWGNQSSMLAPPAYMKAGSKEVSVVKAYMSAAITYATARACREGFLSQCSCSRRQKPIDLPEDWVWGGCGDNTEYGFMFGVGFVDSKEKEMNHPRHSKELLVMLSNTHNNHVGRRIVVTLSKPGCKCHGVSGSCSLKTCWHQLPSFRMIGHELRAMYDNSAVMVKFNKAGTKLIHSYSERKRVVLSEDALRKISVIKNAKKYSKNPTGEFTRNNDVIDVNGTSNIDHQNFQSNENSPSFADMKAKDLIQNNEGPPPNRGSIAIKRRVYRQFAKHQKRHPKKQVETSKRLVVTVRRPTKDELVFTSLSTNFCESSPDNSWPGTQGRSCKRGSSEPDGCDLMCCGRGYNTFRVRTIERCNCQFVWCCHVQCSSCEKYTDVHVCK